MIISQLGKHREFLYTTEKSRKVYNSVVGEPPEQEEGFVYVWESNLCSINDRDFGNAETGDWVKKEDHRKDNLYTSEGKYEFGKEHGGETYSGIGDIPGWLSTEEPERPEPEPQYKTQFSVLEFRDRFTISEQLAIREMQFTDMEVGLVYDTFQASQFISLNDPRVEEGIDLYIAKGLLQASRKQDLLAPELIS